MNMTLCKHTDPKQMSSGHQQISSNTMTDDLPAKPGVHVSSERPCGVATDARKPGHARRINRLPVAVDTAHVPFANTEFAPAAFSHGHVGDGREREKVLYEEK